MSDYHDFDEETNETDAIEMYYHLLYPEAIRHPNRKLNIPYKSRTPEYIREQRRICRLELNANQRRWQAGKRRTKG